MVALADAANFGMMRFNTLDCAHEGGTHESVK